MLKAPGAPRYVCYVRQRRRRPGRRPRAAGGAAAGGHRVRGDAVCDGLLSTHHSLTLPWLSPSGVQAIEFVDATVPTVGSDAGLFNYILNTYSTCYRYLPKTFKKTHVYAQYYSGAIITLCASWVLGVRKLNTNA